MENHKLLVGPEDEGIRLDVFISTKLDKLSRSYIQSLIESGMVKLNGKMPKISIKVKAEQVIEVNIPQPKKLEVNGQDIPIEILYEDEHLIVVNKPRGMVVHPAHGNYTGTLVNAILYKCDSLSSINGIVRPGIVHRIDKNTSGVLVIAKNDNAHLKLSQQLKDHTMTRKYIALAYGNIKNHKGIIDAPIGRHKTERKKMAVIKEGKKAITHFEVLENFDGYTLIRACLETGRTHQIRVHMAYIGHPLVGDETYGPKKSKIKASGQMLHAEVLGFIHPAVGKYMEFSAQIPEYFKSLLDKINKNIL